METATPTGTPPPDTAAAASPEERGGKAERHEREMEQREAYEYWGYLFKPDKTGTDKLKSLLRGLKEVMRQRYEPSDQPDLTPSRLASFYRDLHGNYDQLFLGTPHESISFIYKSLGCLHSLQPPAYTHATAFTDPTVPALKTEGWIMWQTIQLLLGPEEHSEFIREAVAQFDVKDPETGEVFPKVLPRECFPLEPDKHMVAWYEGVSERLRKEAEGEERRHELEAEHPTPARRIQATERPPRREGDPPSDDEDSVDSRGPALAYFRNPLYRHVDGRPSIVRRNSKRPALSPRPTMVDKGKEAASSLGRFARNIGSPHLWDGRGHSRSREREPRRRSHPDSQYLYPDGAPTSAGSYDNRYSPREGSGLSHRTRRSSQTDRPDRSSSGITNDQEWNEGEGSPAYSPQSRPLAGSDSSSRRRPYSERPVSRDQSLRHSKSHEPTPTQKEGNDYFEGYDNQANRRNSSHDKPNSPPSANGVGPSFGPSASPLFASHVARQPQPPSRSGPPSRDPYEGAPPVRNPSIRRAQGRYPSRSPERGSRSRIDSRDRDSRDRRYESPRRPAPGPRYNPSPAPYVDSLSGPRGPSPSYSGPPMGARYADSGAAGRRDPRDMDPRDKRRSQGGGRTRTPDMESYPSEEGRRSRPKQTRFAETGVSGRRYPDESPWDDRRRS